MTKTRQHSFYEVMTFWTHKFPNIKQGIKLFEFTIHLSVQDIEFMLTMLINLISKQDYRI